MNVIALEDYKRKKNKKGPSHYIGMCVASVLFFCIANITLFLLYKEWSAMLHYFFSN